MFPNPQWRNVERASCFRWLCFLVHCILPHPHGISPLSKLQTVPPVWSNVWPTRLPNIIVDIFFVQITAANSALSKNKSQKKKNPVNFLFFKGKMYCSLQKSEEFKEWKKNEWIYNSCFVFILNFSFYWHLLICLPQSYFCFVSIELLTFEQTVAFIYCGYSLFSVSTC